MKHSITKILNFGAGPYNNWAKRNLEGIYRQLIELAELKGNEKILDVGCGPGNLDLMIAGILGEGSIYGIDIAPKMIEMARKNAEGRGYDIDYRVGSSTELPYKSDDFDVVFTCLMYHHLNYEEKNETIKGIYDILKTSGRYVCLEFQEFSPDGFHRVFLRFYAGNSGILHGLYPPELTEENGFATEKEIKGTSFLKSHHTNYRVLTRNSIP